MKVAYPNNPLMAIAWRDGITWALGNDEIVERFEKETGHRVLARPRAPIEAMVDQAWGEDPFVEVDE